MNLEKLTHTWILDPSLIQHFDTPSAHETLSVPVAHPAITQAFVPLPSQTLQSISPITSDSSSPESFRNESRARRTTPSPYLRTNGFQPYPQDHQERRFSIASSHSRRSVESTSSNSLDEDGRERSYCPDCGRPFKDLKAHMLTHQSERPEKCPITTCSYHIKGFARKYDKNRHTLTHYKGTMVCGFCPGSGSPSEKSFNRADVFKRHLTSQHGVEQTPPNSRRKGHNIVSTKKGPTQAGEATGRCSTCSATFENAQDFYEHLDDCVLRIVQQEEPSEAINERILRAVNDDEEVQETLDRHMLSRDIDLGDSNLTMSDNEDVETEENDSKDQIPDTERLQGDTRIGRSGRGSIMPGKVESS